MSYESEEEMEDENQYYDDYRQFVNMIQPFSASLNNATPVENEDALPGIQGIRQAIHSNSEDLEPLHDTGSSPYRNMASFLLHALFLGDEDLASERSIKKKNMYAMELLLELKEVLEQSVEYPVYEKRLKFILFVVVNSKRFSSMT